MVRDLPLADRPVVLVWAKRVWRCTEAGCLACTWSEECDEIAPRAVLTERARAEICRRVGAWRALGCPGGRGLRGVMARGDGRRARPRPARSCRRLGVDRVGLAAASPVVTVLEERGLAVCR
jgi:hypothetical protein